MFRLLHNSKFRFAQFYQPTKFSIKTDYLAHQVCKLAYYINMYRNHAHHYANLDPLEMHNKNEAQFVRPTDLGIKFQDPLENFKCKKSPVVIHSKNIEQLQRNLQNVYKNHSAVQFTHVSSLEQKEWLYQNYQKHMLSQISKQKKVQLGKTLVEAECFDLFLHKKFVTFKRYSGQGAQSTVVALERLFQKGAQQGFQQIVFGMPHRGRFNVLTNILEYPARYLFRKISGKSDTPQEIYNLVDDVTSHVSQSITKKYNNKSTKVTMVHNPSHLQAQNPVSMGKARSKIHLYGRDKVLNIQVHGDAAICAQGIVYESFCLGKVPKFDIDGTIHIITNNQIGYTTKPIDSRSSKYCSDVAKAFDVPIIHLNSQNIEDVYRVMNFCIDYRKKFKKDILVDLICYRKYGHNQVDQPEFTQPKMYNKIRKGHVSNPKKYSDQLHKDNLVPISYYNQVKKALDDRLQAQFQQSLKISSLTLKDTTNQSSKGPRAFTQNWKNMKPSLYGQEYPTGFDTKMLKQFSLASISYPSGFKLHSRIQKYFVDQRIKSLQKNSLNWATCESMALFSLNFQGYNIRFSGQDVQRGTFSQRHINVTDQSTEEEFNSLNFFANQHPGRGQVEVFNSPLSQNAVMSYEYGYSLDHPNNLAIWEAQFGDFYNTAQVVVDTFLTNSQNKWLRQTGQVLILPHGYDGAGPEHSSCRIQRFLQLANSDGGLSYRKLKQDKSAPLKINQDSFYEDIQWANFSFVCPTRPANMFHLLRRQVKRNFRKPLVIAGPKGLLRLPKCVSKIQDMGPGTKFQRILKYKNADKIQDCQAIMICSGKFVYDLQELIQAKDSTKTALLTIQELFPFPQNQLADLLSKAKYGTNVYWVQEQNMNSGAYEFCAPRLKRILNQLNLGEVSYVGRRSIATTAVGSGQMFKKQNQELREWISSLIV